jgi:hypothetical protein
MRRRLTMLALVAACGGGAGTAAPGASTPPPVDGRTLDAPVLDAAPPDADPGVPLPGFGAITGMCGVLGEPELTGITPALFGGDLDFGADRYDDPEDRDQLTPGGQIIVVTPNEGGSSIFSETFAFEILAGCELAGLVETEIGIDYTVPDTAKADILVTIDGHPIGVSVTRAVTFPFGDPYTPAAATELITRKLDDMAEARGNVVAEDHWDKSMVAVLAYDDQHADVMAQAWADLDPSVRRDSLVVVFVTSGDDLFIYTDQ